MASTHTRRSAEISLQALARGAADYVPKPGSSLGSAGSSEFHRELIDKIRSLGRRRIFRAAPVQAPAANYGLTLSRLAAVMRRGPELPFSLRPFSAAIPRALLVGASTGGPQALNDLIGHLGGVFDRVPVLIAQHMPSTFTTVLAEHLTRRCGRRVHEAEHGEPVSAGEVYLAPGGRHMRVVSGPRGPIIALGDDPPIHFCRPAVDPLLTSAASVWGAACVGLILTGMGSDGAAGAADIVAAGGSIVAQDEATSVVWGMPRAVAQAGLCSLVLPLGEIATTITQLFSGVRP
jgi:two-component system chemotaxis response regulator CheB